MDTPIANDVRAHVLLTGDHGMTDVRVEIETKGGLRVVMDIPCDEWDRDGLVGVLDSWEKKNGYRPQVKVVKQ